MSENNEPSTGAGAPVAKKAGLGSQILGWVILLAIIGGVWQCVGKSLGDGKPADTVTYHVFIFGNDINNVAAETVHEWFYFSPTKGLVGHAAGGGGSDLTEQKSADEVKSAGYQLVSGDFSPGSQTEVRWHKNGVDVQYLFASGDTVMVRTLGEANGVSLNKVQKGNWNRQESAK